MRNEAILKHFVLLQIMFIFYLLKPVSTKVIEKIS